MATKKTASKKAASKKKMASKTSANTEQDIITMILADHKPLKKLIKIMKSDAELSERQAAFDEFCPLLVTHAKPEEQTMYVFMKDDEALRSEGFEGDVEHGLADQMVEEAKRTEDEDLWSARIKVLAELVEHHIEEEEEQLLPDFRKHSDLEQRVQLGIEFQQLKADLQAQGSDDAPPEALIKKDQKKSERQQRLQ